MLKYQIERKYCSLKNESLASITKEGFSLHRYIVAIKKNKFIYLLLVPGIILTLLFFYAPMGGLKIAFQEYNIYKPELSEWIGLENFRYILKNEETLKAIVNTFYVSLVNLALTFPAPIIFALLINEIENKYFKKVAQTISYLPHFLSWISVIGIATALYAKSGMVNNIIALIFGEDKRSLIMANQEFFVPNVIILTLWKTIGWNSVVYLAAISGVDSALYEAATIDGAGKFRQTVSITVPSIMPTVIIMLIWRCGSLFSDNFELIYGMQNAYIDFEVVQTIVYKRGIAGGDYQISTAFGLFQGLVNIVILCIVNSFAKRVSETSVF